MARDRAFSGARATLQINGKVVGWCTGIRGSENVQLQRVDVLGDIDSKEIEAVSRTVTMTADFVRIIEKSLQEIGVWPKGGTTDVIDFEPMTCSVYDEINEKAVFTLEGVVCETRNFTVDRQGLMTTNASFQALRMHDESGSGS